MKKTSKEINIKVNFYENFRYIAGKDTEIFGCPSDTKLDYFIKELLPEKYGNGFKKLLFDEKNNICHVLLILVNGKIIKDIASFELSDNDEITMLLPVAGG
jgi:molybdopterin converting factor small subunit